MKTELWCGRGCRGVVRSASKGTLQFRFSTFAMLAAFLPLIAFAHSSYAQTNTPAPVRPRPPDPRHGGADAGDNASRPDPHIPASCRSPRNGRQPTASARRLSACAGCNVAGRAITCNKRGSPHR